MRHQLTSANSYASAVEAEKAFALSADEDDSTVDNKIGSSGEDTVPPQEKRKVSVFFRYNTILSCLYTGVQRTKSPVEDAVVAASRRKRKAASSETKTTGSQNKRVCIQAPYSIFVFSKVYIFVIFFCRGRPRTPSCHQSAVIIKNPLTAL